ncbi:MAG: hypothetical protein AAFY81_01030, partial [Pseudomonadota bacterium]
MTRIVAIFIASFGLCACNPVANLEEAKDKIDLYQTHYSNSELEDMYAMTSVEFRRTSPRADFENFVSLIENRLGPIETTKRQGFNINTTPAGTVTVVTMQTQFEQGNGTETYTFIGSGAGMKVQGWQVNSN